jgi:hypothetical protein
LLLLVRISRLLLVGVLAAGVWLHARCSCP